MHKTMFNIIIGTLTIILNLLLLVVISNLNRYYSNKVQELDNEYKVLLCNQYMIKNYLSTLYLKQLREIQNKFISEENYEEAQKIEKYIQQEIENQRIIVNNIKNLSE